MHSRNPSPYYWKLRVKRWEQQKYFILETKLAAFIRQHRLLNNMCISVQAVFDGVISFFFFKSCFRSQQLPRFVAWHPMGGDNVAQLYIFSLPKPLRTEFGNIYDVS